LLGTIFSPRGDSWGDAGGGAATIGLVGNLPGIPLPRPEAITRSRTVDETRGLHKAEPEPKAVPPPPEKAAAIPEFGKKRQEIVTRKSKTLEDETPPPAGAIPYGQGGTPAVPYTQFNMGGNTAGGLGFSGPAGGDFAGRYPWYVEAVRRRVSSNWLQSTIDPGVQWAPRAVVSFQILRDGSVTNIEMLRSSGNRSVDNSAVRAILGSSPLERLPNEYSGRVVTVEFWFEFRR